jgi:hypothetical protein
LSNAFAARSNGHCDAADGRAANLLIDLKAARAPGPTVADKLLAVADEVIK